MIDITLCQITMAAGKDIPGSVIQWHLKKYAHLFRRVIIVDGHLTNEAKEFYSQFDNLTVVDSPWDDSYIKQYNAWFNQLNDGDWALYLDDDEIISSDYWLGTLYSSVTDPKYSPDICRLPCVLHLTEDGKKYYAVEQGPSEFFDGQWTKNILIKKSNKIWFRYFGSHCIAETNGEYGYRKYPYYHMKTLDSFVRNDVYQAFLSPEGQGYDPMEARLFKMFSQCYKTTKEFREATQKGTWPGPLKKFAWEKRKEYTRPISRLAWTYYILEENPMPEDDNFMTWQNVKQFVLSPSSMKLFEKNKRDGVFVEVNQ